MTAEFLVDSIDGVTDSTSLSKEWVGLILLPIVGNAAGEKNKEGYREIYIGRTGRYPQIFTFLHSVFDSDSISLKT